jgi:hypothetical protein
MLPEGGDTENVERRRGTSCAWDMKVHYEKCTVLSGKRFPGAGSQKGLGGHVNRIFSQPSRIYLTLMLAARTSFLHLHLWPICHSTSRFKHTFQVMAHGQTDWKPPSRLTEEPILKVYNTLTRTKVRPFLACSAQLDSFFVIRMSLLRGTEGVSSGTTADLRYTMRLIWATQGMLRLSPGAQYNESFRFQKLRHAGHSAQDFI